MRPAKISDERLFQGLSDVFRRKGYDGTSYSDVMKATGLVKASRYHRFPGGKQRWSTPSSRRSIGILRNSSLSPLQKRDGHEIGREKSPGAFASSMIPADGGA